MNDPFDGVIGRSDTETPDHDDFDKARKLIGQHGGDAALAAERQEHWHRTHGGYPQALMWCRVKKAIGIELENADRNTARPRS